MSSTSFESLTYKKLVPIDQNRIYFGAPQGCCGGSGATSWSPTTIIIVIFVVLLIVFFIALLAFSCQKSN